MLHTFLKLAADRCGRSDSSPGRFSPGKRAVLYSLNRRLSEFQSLSRSLGQETMLTWICLTRGYYTLSSLNCKVTNDVTRLRHTAAVMRAHNVLWGTAAAMRAHNVLLQGTV
jgi:hypothetical protein